jgi:hemerythrin-like domain-containing protein
LSRWVCYGIGMDVTDALLGEHGIFHPLVEQLDDALGRCESVKELRVAAEPRAISLLGQALLEIVRRHLAREERLLFGLARKALPDGERADSGTHWAQFRGVTLPE